jgi:hypothetical protein
MQEFFTDYHLASLLKASWQAGVLILLVLAAQWALGPRLSPRWRYGLWLLVVARLALPWTIPSPVSLFNFVRLPQTPVAVSGLGAASEAPGAPAAAPRLVPRWRKQISRRHTNLRPPRGCSPSVSRGCRESGWPGRSS